MNRPPGREKGEKHGADEDHVKQKHKWRMFNPATDSSITAEQHRDTMEPRQRDRDNLTASLNTNKILKADIEQYISWRSIDGF